MPTRTEKPLRVAYEGRTDGHSFGSWALVNRRLLPALRAQEGLVVHACDPGGEDAPGPWDVWLSHYYPGLEPSRLFTPPPTPARKWVCWVAWEQGPVPADWEESWRTFRVAEVWACSEHARRLILASTSLDPAKVRVVPYGVDTALYRPDGERWPTESVVFRALYVGGAVVRKGYDLAVEAYDRAFKADEPTRLVVKLQGFRTFYRTAAPLQRPTRPDVQVLSFDSYTDDQMAALYRTVDVVVQPYRAEGFCLPLLEAMACGVPVVYPAHGPGPEFVPPEAGIAVPVKRGEPDAEDLARALRFLWRHPGQREAMGKAGRKASLGYAWPFLAQRVAQALRAVAREEKPVDAFTPAAGAPAPASPTAVAP